MPEPLALRALHPTAVRLGLGRLHVRPERGLGHGHQRRRGHRQVVVVLVRRRWLRRWLVLWRRLQRGLVRRRRRRLWRGLWLVWRWQGRVQGTLQAGLRVRGQEWLSRARQKGLTGRNERPRGC